MYPDLKNYALDDMVLDTHKYIVFRVGMKENPIVVGYPSAPRAASTVNYGSQKASGSGTQHSSMVASSVKFKRPAISPAFEAHEWYPERRQGRGPKFVKTALDMSYAVSDKIVINELARGGRLDKDGKDKIKYKVQSTKSKGKSSVTKQKCASVKNKKDDAITDKESIKTKSKSQDILYDSQDSSSSSELSMDLDDDQLSPTVLIDQQPTQFCWVGVRATRSYQLSTGRDVRNRCVRIAKIIRIIGTYCKVDFDNCNKVSLRKKD